MLGLITDRTQKDVDRTAELAKKGWANMTPEERAEWTGNIFTPELAGYDGPVNLLPSNDYVSEKASIKFTNDSLIAVANEDINGESALAQIMVGDAENFKGKTLTFSFDSAKSYGGIKLVNFYWYDYDGSDYIASFILDYNNGFTFTTNSNPNGRRYLAVIISFEGVHAKGSYGEFVKPMLVFGDKAQPYVPYTPALATSARKGAYNYNDLNRVEKACAELAERLSLPLTTKTDWTEWDIPTKADMDRYSENIRLIRAWGQPYPTTPIAPSDMSKLTYVSANDIEQIIVDIDETIASLCRCNDLYCGEV